MDARYHTSLTVQDCVHAINSHGTGPEVTSPYSAPLILMYKRQAAGKDKSISGFRSTKKTSHDVSRSKSALGMRLEYQDYLMSDYLHSKRALVATRVSPEMHCVQSEMQGAYPTSGKDNTFKKNQMTRTPMFQNFLTGSGNSFSSGSSSPSDTPSMNEFNADDKRALRISRNGRQSKQGVRHGTKRPTTALGDTMNQTSSHLHKHGPAFTFRYTKR